MSESGNKKNDIDLGEDTSADDSGLIIRGGDTGPDDNVPSEEDYDHGSGAIDVGGSDGEEFEIEQDDKRGPDVEDVAAGVAKGETGEGEHVFEFDFDDVPFNPHVKLTLPGGKSATFPLEDKTLLGSDKERCKLYIPHESISPVHCIFGVKNEKIIIKHSGAAGVNIKGKQLPPGKAFEVPFDKRFKVGQIFVEIFKSLPLDIQKVEVNRNWAAELEEVKREVHEDIEPEDEDTDEDLSTFQRILKSIKGIFVRDEEEDEDEVEDLNPDNVKKLEKKDFEKEEDNELDKYPAFIRPFMVFVHNIKSELGVFESKNERHINKNIEANEKKLVQSQVNNLKQMEQIDDEMAQKLVEAGVENVGDLSELDPKDLKKILKCSEEEAEELINKVEDKVAKGEVERKSKNTVELEKEIERAENALENDVFIPEIVPLYRRGIAALINVFFVFLFAYALMNEPIVVELIGPHLNQLLAEVNTLFNTHVSSFFPPEMAWALELAVMALPYLVIYFVFQVLMHLIFGVTLGQFLMAIRGERNFVLNRFLGLFRFVVGFLLLPVFVLDVIVLVGAKTIKEYIALCGLVRVKGKPATEMIRLVTMAVALIAGSFYFYTRIVGPGKWLEKDFIGIVEKAMEKMGINEAEEEVEVLPMEDFTIEDIFVGIGTIDEFEGRIRVTMSDGDTKNVVSGLSVESQMLIKTGMNSSLKLNLLAGFDIFLFADSEVYFGVEKKEDETPLMFVKEGVVKIVSKANTSEFYVRTNSIVTRMASGSIVISNNDETELETFLSLEGDQYIILAPESNFDDFSRLPVVTETIKNNLKDKISGVELPTGAFTLFNYYLKKPSVPTLVSRDQLIALGNSDPETPSNVDIKGKPLGFFNQLKDTFQPGPGGAILYPYGYYIAPFKGSKYDTKVRRYENKKDWGSVDPKTGSYLPPKGLSFDINGFIPAPGRGGVRKYVQMSKNLNNQPFIKFLNGEQKVIETVNEEKAAEKSLTKYYDKEISYTLNSGLQRLETRLDDF